MARRMDYTIEFDAPAEKIYQDFTSRDYWQTLMDAYRFADAAVGDHVVLRHGERGTDIVFMQNRAADVSAADRADRDAGRHGHHPRTAFRPVTTTSKNRATGTYSASVPHGPVNFGGEYFLTETDTGSQLRLASVCKVHIPFVGGALEDLILHHIKQLFDAEEAFTADWIAEHH